MRVLIVLLCAAVAATGFSFDDGEELVDIPMWQITDEPSGRITGGVEVDPPHSLPYQVGLFIEMSGGTAFCGGSLLNEEWVLTAAHCAQPGSSFEIVLGAHYIRNASEPTQVSRVTTEKFVHPRWSRLTLLNDIALLHMLEPVTFTEAIQPLRLPRLSDILDDFAGQESLMSGWGKQNDSTSQISDTLQAINKTVIAHDTCSPFYFGVLNATAHICTSGSNGQSTCNGDSGGPLVYRETDTDSRFTQIGIVSFGIAFGCEVGWPPVFARLSSYVQWVGEVTGIEIRP